MFFFKQIASKMPGSWQMELKRIHHGRQIRKGAFLTSEPEYKILQEFISPGDWIVDIGANIGYYTKRFSELAGKHGRVIAFEPVPATFSLLAANTQLFANANVTLVNAAVSDKAGIVGMSIPRSSTGLKNYYEAHVSPADDCELTILAVRLDSVFCDQHVSLVKIDAEGHESFVLEGMHKLIERCRPVLIIETYIPHPISIDFA